MFVSFGINSTTNIKDKFTSLNPDLLIQNKDCQDIVYETPQSELNKKNNFNIKKRSTFSKKCSLQKFKNNYNDKINSSITPKGKILGRSINKNTSEDIYIKKLENPFLALSYHPYYNQSDFVSKNSKTNNNIVNNVINYNNLSDNLKNLSSINNFSNINDLCNINNISNNNDNNNSNRYGHVCRFF